MAKSSKSKAPAAPPFVKQLEAFGAAVGSSIEGFSKQITGAGADLEGGQAASGLLDQVGVQIGNVLKLLTDTAASVSSEIAHEIETVLNILDINGLLATFAKLLKGIVEGTVTLFIKLLQELKKIIRVLWELVFGKLPGWLETVLLLIDELANHAVAALFPHLAAELSAGEVMYLNEVRAARRVSQAYGGSAVSDA